MAPLINRGTCQANNSFSSFNKVAIIFVVVNKSIVNFIIDNNSFVIKVDFLTNTAVSDSIIHIGRIEDEVKINTVSLAQLIVGENDDNIVVFTNGDQSQSQTHYDS